MTTDRPLETGWLDDSPADDNLTRRFLLSQADCNVALAEGGGGRVRRDADLVCADGANPVPYLNQALALRPPDDDLVRCVTDFYAAGHSGGTFLSAWPTPDLTPHGWELMGHPMFVARSPFDGHEQPRAGVTIDDVTDLEGIATVERLLAEGYPMPQAVGSPPGSIFPPAALDAGLVLRIGRLDGEPVAAAAAFVRHGVVNLCSAATLPAARRKGVWEALVRSRTSLAPGLPAVAYTSDDSRPGFVRMGFLPLFRFTLWYRPART